MAKTSEAQLKAVKKYQEKTKRFTVRFFPADMDLWDKIQSQPNKQGYIKDLIRKDINREA